jgi:hypothetical protein
VLLAKILAAIAHVTREGLTEEREAARRDDNGHHDQDSPRTRTG